MHLMFSATSQYFISLTNTSVHPAFQTNGDFCYQVYDRILLPQGGCHHITQAVGSMLQ